MLTLNKLKSFKFICMLVGGGKEQFYKILEQVHVSYISLF